MSSVERGYYCRASANRLVPAHRCPFFRRDNSELGEDQSFGLVSKRIRVLWPDDADWYGGEVVAYSAENGKDAGNYADDDSEDSVLGNEKLTLAADSDNTVIGMFCLCEGLPSRIRNF